MAEGLFFTAPPKGDATTTLAPDEDTHLFIRDVWYVAALSKDVSAKRRAHIPILGGELVLDRGSDGVVGGMFNGDPAIIVEQESLIWIFHGETPEGLHAAPRIFNGPGGRARYCEAAEIPADLDTAAYGLLDPAHTPFVHRSPIWRGSGVLKDKQKKFEPNEFGWTMIPHAPVNSDIYKLIGGAITVRIEFTLPGLRAEYITNAKHGVLGLTALTPIDARHTKIREIFFWDTPILSLLRPIIPLIAGPFLQQDVDIMAARRLNEAHGGKGMLVGDSDRQFLWYLALKKEWRAAREQGRAFVNTIEPAMLRWRT